MKHCKKLFSLLLTAAVLLTVVFTTGCTSRTPAQDAPADTGKDGVTASDASDAPAEEPEALALPILDEIDADVTVGVAGSSLRAVQAAVKLIDWGANTGLDTEEIGDAASAWLAARGDGLTEYLQKLEMVDSAYQELLTDKARDALDVAGCEDVEITWGSEPIAPIEAVMQAAGLRDKQ